MTAAESASASGGPTPTTDKVKVAIRVRPFSRREIDLDTKCVVEVKNDQTILHYSPLPLAQTSSKQITGSNVNPTQQASPGNQAPSPPQQQQSQPNTGSYRPPKVFTFDNCFWSFDRDDAHYASQEQVFQELGVSILDSAFQGYNACIFAYGQTGSGKSYTMMGTPHDRGLIPRLCDSIFDRMHKLMEEDPNSSFKLEVSYMEIYNEKVHDLLVPANERHSLKVREHNILGPYVDGLSTLAVSSFEEINNLMAEGNKSRTVASTNMNSESSRSHAVFTLTLTCSIYDPVAKVVGEKVSKMSLVDLAGSERAIKTGAVGERLKEGSNINKSLTTLGLVISKLADQASGRNRKEQFVPYRDSVLTWLLKDNLGGNSKTIMISTISPSADSYEETLSTLRYADRAKRIVNHAVINEDPNNRIIRELREEVEQLREQLLHATVNTGLQERLVESEKLIREMEQTWEEKLRKTEKIHQERQQALEKMGISVQSSGIAVEKDRYYLVNLNADPSMNALLVYYLKPCTLIGRPDSSVEQDIQLSGVGIMPEHAIIEIDKKLNQLWMTPVNSSAITFVNGVRIYERSRLHNMDRILWGNNHFFSLNCPATPNQHMPAPIDNFFDYNYARDEMLTSNNPDLKAMFALDSMDRPTTIMNRSMDGSLSGSTTYLPGIQASRPLVNGSRASSSANLFQSPHQQPFQQRMLEKLAQEREENFRLYLSKLREDIAKANTLAFEANLIAEEMRKQTEFKVTLQIPATNLNPNRLKRGVFVSEPAILVKRKNFPQQIWSMEKFDTNLIEMREQYAEWKERQNYKNQQSTTVKNGEGGGETMMVPSSPNGIQLRNDPFYELQERHLLIGVANIFLEVLMQDVQLDYQVPIISQQGEMVGRLHVEFGRVQGDFGERIADAASSDGDNDDNGSNDESQSTGSSVDQNHHSAQLVTEVKPGANKQPELSSNQIRVRLQIKSARGLPPELSNFVFCQYTVCGLTDMIVLTPVDTTDHNQPMLESSFGSNTSTSTSTDEPINFNHQREFIITLTEEFRELCTDGALSIEVWGHRISANPKISLKSESEQQISKISQTLADRWLELKRKLDLWVEIHELNDQGSYTPVEIQHQPDILTGGIYQLRQGQQRRIVVRVETVADTGTLPFLFESIRYIQVGCVCVRSKVQKSLDSYQEGDLSLLNERWSTVLQKRQSYLQEQINELMNKTDSQKTPEEIEREHRLMNQWVSLVEERKASKCPATGSEIPGAPDDKWEPSTGMEDHVPVIFLDLNTDELNLGNSVGKDTVAGADLILPKEYNGTPFFNLSITSRQSSMDGVQAVAVWDSSVHESVHLNRITASNERIFLILKVCVHLSHPANMDLILRKRIAINVFKKQGLVSSTKNIFKRISRADLNPNGTGIRYEIVASIPKASEDIEDRESLALLAASDVDLTACDGESYIERYTKSVSALESVLMLDRLRQEVAVREQIAKKAKRALQLLSAATANQNATNDCDGQISSELRKTLSVPNMAQFVGHYKPNTNGINSPIVSTLNNRRQQAGNINANSTLHNQQPSSINNGNRADSSFDLSYLTTAAGRWTQKATSLFGSMSGGLNQIIVTDIDIGEQQQPSRPTTNNGKPTKPIKSTSPVPGGKQQPIRQSMRTLMEEPDKQTANSQVKSRAQIKKIDQYAEEGQCFIMFDRSKASNNSNSKRTVRKQSSPQNVEIIVHDHEDEDDIDAEDEHIALYSPTSNFAYLNSCSSDGSSSSGSVQPITNRTTTGTPISNGCPSIPSSLSMPSSSNGSGDEDDDFKRQTGHHHLSAINHLPDWLQTGESVRISPDSKLGTIGYVGETRFASGLWVGVILDTPTGKNDGSVDGVQYFQCRPKFGIFVRPDKLKLDPKGRQMRQIGHQNHKSNTNGRR